MISLTHIFIPNLRFDMEIQYLARAGGRSRYEKLPIAKAGSAVDCALISILQWIALSTQMPRWRLLSHRSRLRALLKACSDVDEHAILSCVEVFDAAVGICSHTVHAVGAAALAATRGGPPCLVCFASEWRKHWALVVGVEMQEGGSAPRVLLLLDASGGEPWACGHNVRLELDTQAGSSVRVSPGYPLVCRHLTGEASAVRLLGLVAGR